MPTHLLDGLKAKNALYHRGHQYELYGYSKTEYTQYIIAHFILASKCQTTKCHHSHSNVGHQDHRLGESRM